MAIRPDKDIPQVRRITVDERLTEDLIRFEVCELAKVLASGEFRDEPAYWQNVDSGGGDFIVGLDEPLTIDQVSGYVELLGLSPDLYERYPWKDLTEGQVFLSGEFEVLRETGTEGNRVVSYLASPGARSFERIDDDVKERVKTLYFELLADRGGE